MQLMCLSIIFFVVVFNSYGAASKLDQLVNADYKPSEHHRQQICNLQDVNTYVRRYVNTFLRYTKLANKELLKEITGDDFVHAKVHFRLTARQLALLQEIYYEKNRVPSLEDLDNLFSTIMYRSTVDDAHDYAFRLFSFIEMTYRIMDVSVLQVISFAILSISLYCFFCKKHIRKEIVAEMIFALQAVEGIQRYFFNLRKANVQYYLKMKEHSAISEECDVSKMSMVGQTWVSFKNLFRGDPCAQAYMQATGHYAEEVSLVESMIEPLLETVSLVMKYIGIYAKDITTGMTGNGWYAPVLRAFMLPVALFAIIAPLLYVFFSSSFKFSSYFGSIGVSSNKDHAPTHEGPPPVPTQTVHPPLENYIRDLRSILQLARPKRAAPRRNSKRQLSAARFPLVVPAEIEETPQEELEFEDCVEVLEEPKTDNKEPEKPPSPAPARQETLDYIRNRLFFW